MLSHHDHSRLPQTGILDLVRDRRKVSAQHTLARLAGVRDHRDRTIGPYAGNS
jgi:hypothetical protein